MTKETTPIILTEAELKLIEIKRQEDKLAEEKREAEMMKKKEDRIAYMKEEAIKFTEDQKKILDYARTKMGELNSIALVRYNLIKEPKTKKFEARLQSWETENKESILLAEEIVEYFDVKIASIDDPGLGIKFKEKKLYRSKFSNCPYATKIVMHLYGVSYKEENRSYERVATIHKKIQEKLESRKRKKTELEIQAIGLREALDLLSAKYPTATCSIAEKGRYTDYRRHNYETFKVVEVKFPNGYAISFSYYGSGKDLSVSYYETLSNPFSTEVMIDFYSNLPKPEKK